jgi:superfamily II DNA or RNA helicase
VCPGQVIEGAILPERVELLVVAPEGFWVHLVGRGLSTGRAHDLRLSLDQMAGIRVVGGAADGRGDPARFRLGIEALRLQLAYEYDPYFALSIAKVDPLPHQLEAVYDFFLKQPRIRFLLADDAGAGKTIMAGLLLKELHMRGLAQRILIVSPANLLFQWQREMQDRFGERFQILRGADLSSAYATNPWQDADRVIASLDWMKRQEVMDSLLRAPRWDLVFVDEAHRMSARDAEHKTERYRLGERLSAQTDHLVLLTATPHKGDPENFCLFLRLLDPEVYADVRSLREAIERQSAPFYLRRTKEAMTTFPDPATGLVQPIFRARDVRTTAFELQPEEFAFYQALTDYVYDQSARAAADPTARGRALGFTMAMYQRRFASSLHAVVRSLERRRKKLADRLATPEPLPRAADIDWETLEEADEEQATRMVEQLEAASLPTDRLSAAEEIAVIDGLLGRARELEARAVSSKLRALRELLTKNGVLDDPTLKLLIFTEHRDTLDWLVSQLRSWNLIVTEIHGSMRPGDRDTPRTRLYAEREFRDEAQILVATEAAGEGINLQFCWLMVNFDIPWNPVRLEQRMGRIHRYGQTHDCLIFNFVAINTFEGRVLDKLLERLQVIRQELGTDQVFDVVGEALPGNQIERLIRERYAGRLSEDSILSRIAEDADPARFARITQSALEGLARHQLNLSALVGRLAEAKERRLVPEVVGGFFRTAAPLQGLHLDGSGGSVRVGRVPRALLQVGGELEPRFGRLGREYQQIVFDKADLERHPTAEWVTPGHPLFEAVRELTARGAEDDLRRGATYYELGRQLPSRLEVYTAAIRDGIGHELHRRLFVIEIPVEGGPIFRQPTLFLDLIAAPGAEVPELPGPSRSAIEQELVTAVLAPWCAVVATDRVQELARVGEHVRLSLDTLIDRQTRQYLELQARAEGGEDVGLALQQSEQALAQLGQRLDRRMAELDREGEIAIADVHPLATAFVLPHPEGARFQTMVSDPEIERIAMEIALAAERARGWMPQDVSAENRGFDILSQEPGTAGIRFIEVKGRAGRGEVSLTRHEVETARRLRSEYWLYVVYDCGGTPCLLPISDPAELNPEPILAVERYRLTRKVVEAAVSDG